MGVEEGRRGILSARIQLYLTIVQLERIKQQSDVLADLSGKHWITELHKSSFTSVSQCCLSLKNCTCPSDLETHFWEILKNLHWYCKASITWTQRDDHKLFIPAVVQLNCPHIPRGLDNCVKRKKRRSWPGAVRIRVCVGGKERKWMWGFFYRLVYTCKNTHQLVIMLSLDMIPDMPGHQSWAQQEVWCENSQPGAKILPNLEVVSATEEFAI